MLAKKASRALLTSADPRWAQVRARDPQASFFYSVATTGVYCRPSCGARPARPENVEFHATAGDAERHGFRACKRCKPDQPSDAERKATLVATLCRVLEERSDTPTLEELAEIANMSAFYTQRVFKAVTGLTPRAYAAGHRAARVKSALRTESSVTAAVFEAGYGSSARFYESSTPRLGMTPGAYRAGGEGASIRFAVGQCALGSILVAATTKGICAIFLGDDPEALVHDLERSFPNAELVGADAHFEQLVARVVAVVEARGGADTLPLDIRGTAFQERVWQALMAIPTGTTTTYAELARQLGAPRSVRAVAHACASNRLAVAIPCHRVVRRDGSLAGYRWGIDRKRALLDREAP